MAATADRPAPAASADLGSPLSHTLVDFCFNRGREYPSAPLADNLAKQEARRRGAASNNYASCQHKWPRVNHGGSNLDPPPRRPNHSARA
ncbi:hypothetical protein GCM10009738_14280 [Kitasatospora viridis]